MRTPTDPVSEAKAKVSTERTQRCREWAEKNGAGWVLERISDTRDAGGSFKGFRVCDIFATSSTFDHVMYFI